MPDLRLLLLGAPRIEYNGAPVETDTRKAVALLAFLTVTGESQRRETLAALLWPEYDHAHAMGALRRTLSSIRKAVGEEILETTREIAAVSANARLWTDVAEFHRLIDDCKTHGHNPTEICQACLTDLAEAVRLYRDHFMAGFSLRDSAEFDEWQFFQAETLRREFSGALEWLVQGHTACNQFDRAIPYAQRWLAIDPLHEPAHRQLMQLYAWSGHRNAALRQYQECVRIFEQELGVPPLEETTALYQLIKENRLTPPGISQPLSVIDQLPIVINPQARAEEMDHGLPEAPGVNIGDRLPLFGRSGDLEILKRTYAAVIVDGHFTVLTGEAGIGKTSLAEVFLDRVRSRGGAVLSARCYQGESDLAYGPFVEVLHAAFEQTAPSEWWQAVPVHWLSEAARLLPELRLLPVEIPATPSLETPGAQIRFFEGIRQLLQAFCGSNPPGVLFLDDLHWADEASIDLLTYLVRRLHGKPIYLLATWREEDVSPEHRLRVLLAESQRAGNGTLISLTHLAPDSVKELVQSAAANMGTIRTSADELSERLYRETEGIPFFVVEYLRAIANGSVKDTAEEWSIPHSVRDLLHTRLAQVNETGLQLLQTAAAIGRSFDFEVLREASGRSEEEAVTALEALVQRGLIRELQTGQGGPAGESWRGLIYDFLHEKIRDLVYEETSSARRKILHRRIAEALPVRARNRWEVESLASSIAKHYQMSGESSEAAQYFMLAGDHARSLYANSEALSHFRSALALGHPQVAEIHEAIGDLQTLSGDYGAALDSYESAVMQYDPGSWAVGCVEHKIGNVWHRIGEWNTAEKHFQAALGQLNGTGRTGEAARVYADWSLNAHHQGHTDQSLLLAQQALELADQAGDQKSQAQTHNILGILARSKGDLVQAQNSLEKSLSIAEASGDLTSRAAALNNLALVYGSNQDLERALDLTETALSLCSSYGDRHREAALHNNLADLLYAAGQSEAAMSHLKQAVAIFAEIGITDSAVSESRSAANLMKHQPEIWKLSEW